MVEQVLELLLVTRKNVTTSGVFWVFFSFRPEIFFKTFQFSFLEATESLKRRWPQKMIMNNSVGEEEGKKTELNRAATVCRLYKTSVLHYGSAHCKLLSFSSSIAPNWFWPSSSSSSAS